jgi:hypothetical protein
MIFSQFSFDNDWVLYHKISYRILLIIWNYAALKSDVDILFYLQTSLLRLYTKVT